MTRKSPQRRKGAALYITVLATAFIVSLLGMAGMTIVRIERRQAFAVNYRLIARANARSAVELGLRAINSDSNWRTTYTSGAETTPLAIGSADAGTVSFVIEDSDGSLTDGDTDLRLKGVGRIGDTVQVSSIGITQPVSGLDCLDVAVCVGGGVNLYSNSMTTTNQTLAGNSFVSTNSGTVVNSDVEAVGSISGGGYSGSTTSPVPPRTLPEDSAFDYYLANGKSISISSLPRSSGYRVLEDVVLSPNSNPFGATDPEGIYIIDCAGGKLKIRYCRIIGTLVLINPSSLSRVDDQVHWEPANPNFPALMIQGGILRLEAGTAPLDEAARGVNFNPSGSPYEGWTDFDQVDTYPSVIKGLIYASGGLIPSGVQHVDGAVIVKGLMEVFSEDTFVVNYDGRYAANPPPGFIGASGGPVIATPGSWLWDAAP